MKRENTLIELIKVTHHLQCDQPNNFLRLLVEHEKVRGKKIFFTTRGYHGYQIKQADTKYCTKWRHKCLINPKHSEHEIFCENY